MFLCGSWCIYHHGSKMYRESLLKLENRRKLHFLSWKKIVNNPPEPIPYSFPSALNTSLGFCKHSIRREDCSLKMESVFFKVKIFSLINKTSISRFLQMPIMKLKGINPYHHVINQRMCDHRTEREVFQYWRLLPWISRGL